MPVSGSPSGDGRRRQRRLPKQLPTLLAESTTPRRNGSPRSCGAAGFDGIYYAARHDPSFVERSIALFGPAGSTEGGKPFDIINGTIPDDLIDQVAAEFRLHLLPAVPLHDSGT